MNQIKTVFLLGILTALLMLAGQALGGQSGMVMGFALAVIMNFGSYWFSDKIVLAMYRAQPVDESTAPDFYRLVKRLTERAGLPMPKVYVIPTDTPNAFATGRDPNHAAVAATQGLLRILNADEIEGVMAHELAHVRNRDTLISAIAATIAGAIGMMATMARFAMIFGGGRDDDNRSNPIAPILMLVTIVVVPLMATIIQLAISRSREYMADQGGAEISGKPLGLANALRKLEMGVQAVPMDANPATSHMFIVNPLSGGGLMSLLSTHPSTSDRIARLEAMAQRGVGSGNRVISY